MIWVDIRYCKRMLTTNDVNWKKVEERGNDDVVNCNMLPAYHVKQGVNCKKVVKHGNINVKKSTKILKHTTGTMSTGCKRTVTNSNINKIVTHNNIVDQTKTVRHNGNDVEKCVNNKSNGTR